MVCCNMLDMLESMPSYRGQRASWRCMGLGMKHVTCFSYFARAMAIQPTCLITRGQQNGVDESIQE